MATASIVINGTDPGVAKTDLPLNGTVYLSNNDNTGVVSHEWVIVSQPAGDQDDLIPFTTNPIVSEAAAPQFTPTKEGSYLIRLTVNKDMADEAIDTTICAVKELLTGDRIPAPQETTEVSATDGWATAAVTKILQRVTRLSDAGIFVAQNASAGDLSLGKVVHMNGMTTIGTGTNQRRIPTVDLALGNVLDTVDGPLGVMVGNRDGDPLAVAVGGLCRVMVMGGIAGYTSLGTGGTQGDPVFVGNDGSLSLTEGFYVRQVGDIAKVITDGVYDIAISAGANSIPRGNAGNDLSGSYPDPTVARINGTIVGASTGAAVGNVLRVTDMLTPEAEWGPVDLANTDAVTNALPMANGGTGQALYQSLGGIVYSTTDSKLEIAPPGTAGYLLTSGGAGAPSWVQYVPLANGGTNTTLAAALTNSVIYKAASALAASNVGTAGQALLSGNPPAFGALSLSTSTNTTGNLPLNRGGTNSDLSGLAGVNGVVCKVSSTAIGVTAAGSTGALLTPSIAGVPTWTTAGTAGQLLQNNGGLAIPTWVDFSDYFDAQYAGSSFSTDALYSTTGGAYTEIAAVTRSCKKGMVQITPMPIADGSTFLNYITTASTNNYSTVSLKYQVTFPNTSVQNYLYQFRTSVAHNNNQNTGSITFPSLTFYTSQDGDHEVSLQATITAGDTFTVQNIALRISQG